MSRRLKSRPRFPHTFIPLLLIMWCYVSLNCLSEVRSQDLPEVQSSTPRHLELVQRYCIDCHHADEQQGDRQFDQLGAEITADSNLVDYQEIVDQLNLGKMPPLDAEQPSAAERREMIAVMSGKIKAYHAKLKGSNGRTPLRRLNAREYRNTVRDLFQIDMRMFDPTTKFPRDQTNDWLDNHAETLTTSGHLLQAYLNAAEQIVNKAAGRRTKPEQQVWSFTDHFNQQPEIDQVHRKTNGFTHLTLYDVIHADKHEGAYAPIHLFAEGVPADGFYEIRFEAEAVNRRHPYDPQFLGMDPSDPLRLGIVAGHQDAGTLHLPQPIEPLLAEQTLADEKRWYSCVVWLDEGFTPRFTFPNGLMDARNLWSRLIRKYPDQFPPGSNQGIVKARYNAIALGKLPHIRIYDIEIEGPILEQWPTAPQRELFGADRERNPSHHEAMNQQAYRDQILHLARRAYRRPVLNHEADRLLSFFDERAKPNDRHHQSFLDTVKVILCSPQFLYLSSDTYQANGVSYLSAHALAARLSYFLWSSMPDEELMNAADDGTLLQEEVLREQAERLLSDPKSQALVTGFLDSWLGLRELGATPPDRGRFNRFYHKDLDAAMRQETLLFTSHILGENLPAINFIDSNFTFANAALAKHYGMDPIEGTEFKRVTLTDPLRGGLLGQASVLTLTANGIDTSPVIRGVWVLEHLLGMPPSPPPPDVEPLDPDVRGAKSIRDQLEKHRSNPACFDCHQEIDPLGFALEQFDPIGGLRTRYPSGQAIDTSGELPNGHKFQNIAELKKELGRQQDFFHRAVASKLLSYGIGRHPEPLDRRHIESILDKAGSSVGLRDLVIETVMSEAFRQP
ncbi:MAG: DUF1592 domain-containing protein [Rubripirellula sp.]|nr:DUF1592 domain-containing protein [Rubripirellula sp.]